MKFNHAPYGFGSGKVFPKTLAIMQCTCVFSNWYRPIHIYFAFTFFHFYLYTFILEWNHIFFICHSIKIFAVTTKTTAELNKKKNPKFIIVQIYFLLSLYNIARHHIVVSRSNHDYIILLHPPKIACSFIIAVWVHIEILMLYFLFRQYHARLSAIWTYCGEKYIVSERKKYCEPIQEFYCTHRDMSNMNYLFSSVLFRLL